MSESAQRAASIVLGAGVVVLAAWIAMSQSDRRPARAEPDAGASATQVLAARADASTESPASSAKEADLDAGLSLALLADGGLALPTGAPRSVKIGVVLVQFAGAEGASSTARSKRDALSHAQALAASAKEDWKRAVKDGDSGSAEDVGRIPRGVLDAATEVAVFSLAPGDVSGVLETPRGYWIVKRVE